MPEGGSPKTAESRKQTRGANFGKGVGEKGAFPRLLLRGWPRLGAEVGGRNWDAIGTGTVGGHDWPAEVGGRNWDASGTGTVGGHDWPVGRGRWVATIGHGGWPRLGHDWDGDGGWPRLGHDWAVRLGGAGRKRTAPRSEDRGADENVGSNRPEGRSGPVPLHHSVMQ